MGCCLSIRKHRLEPKSAVASAQQIVFNPVEQVDREEEAPESPLLGSLAEQNEQMVITAIRVENVVSSADRITAGLFAVVHHSDLEWRTETKRPSMGESTLEWNESIPIPTNLSATISLAIYASLEFQPVVGSGVQLREITIVVEQLLRRSAKGLPYDFFDTDGGLPPCSSILITIERHKCKGGNSSAARVLQPYRSGTESRDQPEHATNKGHSALLRYRNHMEMHDLEHAIEQFERALDICPPGHPCRTPAHSNLASAESVRCELDGVDAPLDIPLRPYHDSLSLRPVGHPDRSSTLTQLAKVHLARFRKQRDEPDASDAEVLLQEAINLSSPGSAVREAAVSAFHLCDTFRIGLFGTGDSPMEDPASGPARAWGLSIVALGRYESSGDLADLEQAISFLKTSISCISVSDSQYLSRLTNLGLALRYRFDHLGDSNDLEEAISRQRHAVSLASDDHPDKPMYLSFLSNSLQTRFQYHGDLNDLEQAISGNREAVAVRFEHLGELYDLEEAISRLRHAVALFPVGHPDAHKCLSELGISLLARFAQLRKLSDIEEAVLRLQDAVAITPDGYLDKCIHLSYLGHSLLTRFDCLGELKDLEEAVLCQRGAVDLAPDGHLYKFISLGNLGSSLIARFLRLGELGDLEEAISRQRHVVDLLPDGYPDRLSHLNSLGISLKYRFERLGDLNDLEEAMSMQRSVTALTPDGHPDKPRHLNSLGSVLRARFERLGDPSNLKEAVLLQRDAVDLTPDENLHKAIYLNSLSQSLAVCFDQFGELSDLEEAILRQQSAVTLTPNEHPEKASYLTNLGSSFLTRFRRLGDLSDLEEAILRQRDAVNLTPDDHPDRLGRLDILGISLRSRFDSIGDLNDLEEAISRQRNAVALTSDGHPQKAIILCNLGDSLLTRFWRLGALVDLEEAISSHSGAVNVVPDDHPNKPAYLNSLSKSFIVRSKIFGELKDLEDAITGLREAVELIHKGHPDKPPFLRNLGRALETRFERVGEWSDLGEAISRQLDAVILTPDGHPDKPIGQYFLGCSFVTRFEHLKEPSDLEKAISLYSHAACSSTGPITDRFLASRGWIFCARVLKHQSLLQAYTVTISLLPQLAWVGRSLPHRYRDLDLGAGVVREAAAAALELGYPEIAVEWLEHGRAIVWEGLSQLRSSHDDLSLAYPDLARKLRELSAALEHASIAREESSIHQARDGDHRKSQQREADRQRTLAIKRDKLLVDIRTLPGFEQFLLRKEFSQLRASAHSGPVVILNATESRCDALIVHTDVDHVIHIPLPNFTLERSKELQTSLNSFVRRAQDCIDIPDTDDRAGRPIPQENACPWRSALSPLWKCVVKPVLDALALSSPGNLSRIFWCPTGPFTFLPVHAAGFYDIHHSQPGHKVYDFVVSSYIPTLSILASPPKPDLNSRRSLRLLAVRQPPTDGLRRLPGVDTELEHIRTVIKNFPTARTTLIESSSGTVEEVLSLIKEADWVHFSCHGIQDGNKPTESGLCLADRRRLKLTDAVSLSRPPGGLAFLSACQTAMGDRDLPDEAIHISAGMLFAGYRGVIGTMWAISDKHAPDVAKDVYEQLFQNGTTPDYRDAARALQDAVGRLRDGNASFIDWVPFIHVGL